MENPSFVGDAPSGSPPKEPKNNPLGPSQPLTRPSGDRKIQQKESSSPLSDDKNESPPAYVKRYMKPKLEMADLDDLEPPSAEPDPEPHADHLNQEEFMRQAMKRKRRRYNQYLVEGPCALRPDDPNLPPLPPPEPYSDFDIQHQPAGEPEPRTQEVNASAQGQQGANAADPGEQLANLPDPDQQEGNTADPEDQGDSAANSGEQGDSAANSGEQGDSAANSGEQGDNAADPGKQGANAADPGDQVGNAPDPGEQVDSASTSSPTWRERCDSFYEVINSFSFQFPFHMLLLTWPLSTAILGALNLGACSIDFIFPYIMMGVGVSGTATVLVRLFVIYYAERVVSDTADILWILIKAVEGVIWAAFILQLYLFFKQDPSFNRGDAHYCKMKFYKANCGLMFMTSATMIGWIVVNVGQFIYWLTKRSQPQA